MAESRHLLRVLFLCRGSVQDGLGHVMRSRTVAHEMARRAAVELIVLGDEHADALLEGRGVNYHILPRDADPQLLIDEFDPHVLVFDLTDYDEAAFDRLVAGRVTVSLSPIFNRLNRVDLLFHRTRKHGHDWSFGEGGPETYCGLEYAVVREDCARIPEEMYQHNLEKNPLSVVISMGGADASNKTLRVLEALRSVPNPLLFWVMLGEGYGHSYQALVEAIQSDVRHEVILAKTNDSMWRIAGMCSLAILAGGTVTYEAAFAGLPSINIFDAEKQVFLATELVEEGACLSAGHPFQDALSVVRAHVAHLDRSRDQLRAMHQRSQHLIDGQGAARIARGIEDGYWTRWVESSARIGRPDVEHVTNTLDH